jgi:RNA polymerase sigma factor for flagellar operon FliA
MSVTAVYVASNRPSPDEIVTRYAGLVKRIAYHFKGRLPSCVQVEDLIQAGMIGLLDAAKHYDPTQGASFETYASIRIRGAMHDEMRVADWTPRSVHRKAREAAEAIRIVERREGREAHDAEVAVELGVSVGDFHRILTDSVGSKLLSLEDPGLVAQTPSPEESSRSAEGPGQQLESNKFREALVEAIAQLPERERLVVALYYDEELNLREIGCVLKVSESRVCQIHGQALLRLRARLQDWLDGSSAIGGKESTGKRGRTASQ